MSLLALVLFGVVLMTHAGYEPIASLYHDPGTAAREWFYALRGVEGAVLFLVIAALRRRDIAVVAVCAWGVLEESMSAVCRLAQPMGVPTSSLSGGLCSDLSPIPVYLALAGIVGYWSRHGR